MKKQIITLTAIVAVLVAVIFAGCVEKEAPASAPISNQDFKDLCAETFDIIAGRLERIMNAMDKGDIRSVKKEIKSFKTMIKIEIMDLKETSVSEEALPCKQEMLAFLTEMQSMALDCEKYIATQDQVDFMMFEKHRDDAMAHGAMAVKLGENL